MIEQTIYALLKDIAPTYPIHHQKLYPCITYTIISGSERYSHDGNSNLKQVRLMRLNLFTFSNPSRNMKLADVSDMTNDRASTS